MNMPTIIPKLDTRITCDIPSQVNMESPKTFDFFSVIELSAACENLGHAFTNLYRAILKRHLDRDVTPSDQDKFCVMQAPGDLGTIFIMYDNKPIAVVRGIGSSNPLVSFIV